MAMCAAESAIPTCAVTILLNSVIADAAGAGAAASTAGSQAGLTVYAQMVVLLVSTANAAAVSVKPGSWRWFTHQ
jgi:hypothetical protein